MAHKWEGNFGKNITEELNKLIIEQCVPKLKKELW